MKTKKRIIKKLIEAGHYDLANELFIVVADDLLNLDKKEDPKRFVADDLVIKEENGVLVIRE